MRAVHRKSAVLVFFTTATACGDAPIVDSSPFGAATSEGEVSGSPAEGSDDDTTGTAYDESDGDSDTTGMSCSAGMVGCSCYGNETCNEGLRCRMGECVPEACGNGIVEGDEECDDGNDDDNDDCLSTCVSATCGDGIVHAGVEECDDGNDIDDDGCTNACTLPKCGDGVVQDDEECDDGNDDDHDDCLTTCVWAVCGDGIVQAGVEECDDGNDDDTDDCPSTCMFATCGDGFVHADLEECDDGMPSNEGGCLEDCTIASCGDGFVHAGFEDCDGDNLGGNTCATQGLGWTGGEISCEADCTADVSACFATLDNTNSFCTDALFCLAYGPHAQQECFIGLGLPQPYTLTEVSYNIYGHDNPTSMALEVYAWTGSGPGTLLASEPLSSANFSFGVHTYSLPTPVVLESDSFCVGLRADAMFSLNRDPTSGPGHISFIEAPECGATSFGPISGTGMSGNFCIRPTLLP
jgi:cysteine-rich repeat protein